MIERPPPNPGDGGVLGQQGIIIWRTACFLEKSLSAILRVGSTSSIFPYPTSIAASEESRLLATGDAVSLASCLGRDFEISYDRDGSSPDAIGGTFRVPCGFWNTFEFRSAEVEEPSYEIRIPVRFCSAGIGKYNFIVPQTLILDCQTIEESMSNVFAAPAWRRIAGPQSDWFS